MSIEQNQNAAPAVEKATPEMYAMAGNASIPQQAVIKKGINPLLYLLMAVVILLLIAIVFFAFNQNTYRGVVDPAALRSRCVGGTKLTWWAPDTVQTAAANYTEIINNFNAQRGAAGPITIEVVNRKYDNYDYYTNLLNAMAKGAGPDIFMLRNDDLKAYQEYIIPFASVDSRGIENYRKAFVDLIGQETVINEKLYGVATYVDNLQLYYNKSLLDQNSIPTPAVTWSDIQRQARVLSKPKDRGFNLSTISLGIGNIGAQRSNITDNQDIIPMLISQYGGTIYDERTNTIGFQINDGETRNAFTDALNFYLDFSNNRSDQYSWDEFMGNNVDEFLQNRLVYMVGYKELDRTIRERRPDLDYQVTSLPQVNDRQKRTFGRYFVNVLSKSLGTVDAAASDVGVKRACAEEFLRYIASEPAQKSYIAQTQMPSAYRSILTDQLSVSGDQKTRIFAEGALIAVNYFKPDVLNTEEIWGDLATKARSSRDLNTALNEAVAKYNQIVSAGPQIRQK